MIVLAVLLTMVGIGGLCYPRRPRATGVLFVAGGVWVCAAWTVGWMVAPPAALVVIAAPWVALGVGQIWRFRDPAVRASHRAGWIGGERGALGR